MVIRGVITMCFLYILLLHPKIPDDYFKFHCPIFHSTPGFQRLPDRCLRDPPPRRNKIGNASLKYLQSSLIPDKLGAPSRRLISGPVRDYFTGLKLSRSAVPRNAVSFYFHLELLIPRAAKHLTQPESSSASRINEPNLAVSEES